VTRRRARRAARPNTIEACLRDVYRRVAVSNEFEAEIDTAVSRLTAIARRGPAGATHPFNQVGARRTRAEIEAVAAAADAKDASQLNEALGALHSPAINALAAVGILRHGIRESPTLSARAHEAAAKLERADPEGGRPRRNLVHAVSAMIIKDYERLTSELLQSSGIEQCEGLATAARDIFRILDISADPRTALRGALADRNRRKDRIQFAGSDRPPNHPIEINRRNRKVLGRSRNP
jgi:hypothetical protein